MDSRLDGPRALRPGERRSALKLINSALRPGGSSNILKEYPLVLSEENMENMRVIVQGNEVVSHAAMYFSELRSGDLVFKVGGVGSVATHRAHRGRGLASAVLRDCIRLMRESGCHLSALWTQLPDFYRTLGYEAAGSEYIFRAKAADFAHLSGECEVVRYSPRYLPGIIDIHERERLRTHRTRKEYEAYFGLPKAKKLLALREGSVSAYGVMGKGEDFRNCVHEWGGRADDILCLIREFLVASLFQEVLILTPASESEFTHVLKRMRLPKALEHLAMMQVIDVDGVSSLVQGYLSARLGRGFCLSGKKEEVTLRVGEEKSTIARRALVRLLFGPDSPSSALPGLSNDTLRALDNALPIPLFIWGLDSV